MNIFVTGCTGTLGTAVIQDLLKDEKQQSEMAPHERLTLILGDVRDKRRLIESTRNMDLVLHFAALKRVDTLEANPEESIATNVYGTENVLGAQRINKIP